MDFYSEDSNCSSSSKLDSDLEDSLYSRIHHEWSHDRVLTPNKNIVYDIEPSIFTNINSFGTPCTAPSKLTLPPSLKSTEKLSKNDVIIIDSSDECKIIDERSTSRFNRTNKKNARKRKLMEEDIICVNSDSESKNIYVHLDGIGAVNRTEGAEKLIYVDNNSEIISPFGNRCSNVDTFAMAISSNSVPQEVKIGDGNNFSSLSAKELLDRNMNIFFNSFTATHITNMSSQEIVKSLKGAEWFTTPSDRNRLLGGKSKARGILCENCRERGHIKRFCKAPKKKIHCYLCGGNHPGEKCDKRCCAICWRPGHFQNRCPERKKYFKMRCTLCKCYGHSSTYCADLWRKYHLTTKEGPIIASSTSLKPANNSYCANCAQKGHFVHECKKDLMDDHIFVHRPDIVSYSGLLATPENQFLADTTNPSPRNADGNSKKKSPKNRNKILTYIKEKIVKETTQFQNYFIKPKRKSVDRKEKKLKDKIKKKKLKKKLAQKGNKKSWKINGKRISTLI